METGKKILLVGEFGKFGGTRTYFNQILNFYLKRGFNVTVGIPVAQLDVVNVESLPCLSVVIPDCSMPSILNFLLKRFHFNALLEWLCIRRVYSEQRPDLLTISTGSPGKYLGCFLFSAKFLYILHTYPHSHNGEPLASKYFKKFILGIFLTHQKQMVTVSSFAQKTIAHCLLLPSKHQFVRFIRNTAGSEVDVENNIVGTNTNKKTIKILTIGHVAWYKNPSAWLEVAKLVLASQAEYVIQFVWAGDGDLYIQCQNWVIENSLEDSIKFIGFQANVEQLYLESDVYFQPSLIETQGLAVIEAMRYGLPCVVSNKGGLPESVLADKSGFIVDVGDINKMAEKILYLVQDGKLREDAGLAGKKFYNERFSESLWEKNMVDLHEEILN